ncbi:MAG: translation initiation factor IF-2 N-terminal domain-containing protein, partial [Desulfobulbaceae bacterium]|nr:translation initiation factor IF-2 N-terminal domain-containing protein [Desulfobulbaceae bacterium]
MSKIRIYDLAKEAGIKSTELADKLIDLGYNIKGHSSSIEEEVADEIRRNVLGTVETEVVEKRINTKGHATIIRRRSQTVHRASEEIPVTVEEKVAADAAATAAAEEPVEEIEAVEEPVEKKSAEEPAKKKTAKKKKEDVSVTPVKETGAEIEPTAAAAAAAETPSTEDEPEQEPGEQKPEEIEKKEEEKSKPKVI